MPMNAMLADTGEDDCEALVTRTLDVADSMLTESGRFSPFGMIMQPDGEVSLVAVDTEGMNPPADELIEIVAAQLCAFAQGRHAIATALAYDVRVVPPGRTAKSDAIAVELEHVGGYGATLLRPYARGADGVSYGRPFGMPSTRGLFASRS